MDLYWFGPLEHKTLCLMFMYMQTLLNLGSSRIELAMGDYKLGSVTNGMAIVPHKWWSGSPFIARRGEGLIVYSLIVVGLYFKGSGFLAESLGSS
jgi:hypothetical protein